MARNVVKQFRLLYVDAQTSFEWKMNAKLGSWRENIYTTVFNLESEFLFF